MSNKARKNKQNITKISAHSEPAKITGSSPAVAPQENKDQKDNKVTTAPVKAKNKAKTSKTSPSDKPLREVFILVRPFVALGRYLRDSWREIRQVRWPNRKATWKMTFAVLIYCAIFFAFILLLDTFFTFIFNLLLGINK